MWISQELQSLTNYKNTDYEIKCQPGQKKVVRHQLCVLTGSSFLLAAAEIFSMQTEYQDLRRLP